MKAQLPVLPLEEIGLYLMLERIHHGTAAARDFAQITMMRPALVEGSALNLSEAGKDQLQLLRAKLAAWSEELAPAMDEES